jgi:hypothetical protein
LFVASEHGLDATGIELLPVGCEVIAVRRLALDRPDSLRDVVEYWHNVKPWRSIQPESDFQHLRITQGAFSEATQHELDQYLTATQAEEQAAARLLRFAAMCVLEEISYTRKDGQYLRWDSRSGRRQGKKRFDKGYIASFEEAITKKLNEIQIDLSPRRSLPGLFDVVSESQSL